MDVLTVRSALWIMSIFILLLLRPAGNPWGSFQFADLHAQVRKLALSVITGVLLVSAVAIFISYRLSRSFAEKIHTVTAAMKKASEGDFSVNLAEGISKNEFNDLNTGFNHMIQKINSLIQTVYKAELLRKEAEYASLQAQTNSTFSL